MNGDSPPLLPQSVGSTSGQRQDASSRPPGAGPPTSPLHEAAAPGASTLAAQIAVLAAACALFGIGLGATDLWAPDEPRYARIADELRSFAHGFSGLFLLHLNGEVYTQKPPLYFWLAAALGAPGGRVTEVAARLPSVIAGIACIALTLRLGRRLLPSPAAAWIGAGVLLTTVRFAHQARRAQLDVLLCAFELVAMLAAVRFAQGVGSARVNIALLHAACGLAVLTKGPVGLLPLLVMAVHLAVEGRARELRALVPAWGFALSLGPAVAWALIAIALAPAGYANDAVLDNVVARFFQGTDHVRPVYYFVFQLPLDFLPWTLVLPLIVGWRALRGEGTSAPGSGSGVRLLWIWLAVHFVFFTLSAGKRGVYLLPVFPALALLCGAALASWLRAPDAGRVSRIGRAGASGLMVLGSGGAIASLLSVWPATFQPPTWFGLALLALGATAWSATAPGVGRRRRLAAVFGVLLGIELAMFTLLYPAFDAEKSPRPVARLAREWAEQEPIGIFEQRALAGGVAYYADHPVVTLRGERELAEFVAGGGRSVVVRRSRFEEFANPADWWRRGSVRSGRRELWIVSPRSGVSPRPNARIATPPGGAEVREASAAEPGSYPTGL